MQNIEILVHRPLVLHLYMYIGIAGPTYAACVKLASLCCQRVPCATVLHVWFRTVSVSVFYEYLISLTLPHHLKVCTLMLYTV